MPTLYIRRFNLKPSLTRAEVLDAWKFYTDEQLPAIREFEGVRSARSYSGAGGLVADLHFISEVENAAVYERMLVDPAMSKLNAAAYAPIDMHTSTQQWLREITPELIKGLSATR